MVVSYQCVAGGGPMTSQPSLCPTGCQDSRDPLGTSHLNIAKSLFPPPFVRRWYWTSTLRVLVIELNNLGHRIQWALEIRAWELGGYKAPLPTLWDVAPVRPCSHYIHAYIRYTQTLLDRHPFLSTADLSLVGEGWKNG